MTAPPQHPVSASNQDSLFADLSAELSGATNELRAFASAQWRLLQSELTAARDQIRALAIAAATSVCAAMVSLPLLIVAVVDALDGQFGWPRWAWLLASGVSLLVGATTVGWLAWRRMRRDFIGLAESMEELREDVIWFQELRARDRRAT